MNPYLDRLQPYPFQKLRALFQGITPNPTHPPINLSIGEPKHDTPELVRNALIEHLDGLAKYPATQGSEALRQGISDWVARRYGVPPPDAQTQVLPVNGSREALFAFAQAVLDPTETDAVVLAPNPFYQIYEGAALLAGATPYFLNSLPTNHYATDFASTPPEVLARARLAYACSPGNPTGKVMGLADWQSLFDLSDRYGFVIAADECYSEIYADESAPPLGALQAAQQLGRGDYRNLVVFNSLSKRSNVPGMRSGFVAGDAVILQKFLLYRTYHGCAMSPTVQAASLAAWNDEAHVRDNRRLYAEKFAAVASLLRTPLPDAGFYLWMETSSDDTDFAKRLYADYNVTVLPGSFLAREAHGINPGRNFVRIALVAPLAECVEAARRISDFIKEKT